MAITSVAAEALTMKAARSGPAESFAERANQLGTVLKDWTPAETDKFAKSEVAAWGQVIRDNNITMSE